MHLKYIDTMFGPQEINDLSVYVFRGLPINIQPENSLWFVAGGYSDHSGGGILEWCYDEGDANNILEEMKKDSRFSNLSAGKYK